MIIHADPWIVLDALEAHNISVWVDVVGLNAGVNFLNKIGQAIIDSKVRIPVKSRPCNQAYLMLRYLVLLADGRIVVVIYWEPGQAREVWACG